MPKQPYEEIGRELKVSELKPRTVVWLAKEECGHIASFWVVDIGKEWVHFRAGAARTEFFAQRCGPNNEEITDSTAKEMKMYEYLGEV